MKNKAVNAKEDIEETWCFPESIPQEVRLVMISWGADYRIALESSRMWLGILAGYVDDVRQDGTGIGMGKKI